MGAWRVVAGVSALGIVVAYAVGSGRWVTTGSGWYLSLQQPPWQPPPPVFGLAWSYNFMVLGIVGVVMSLTAPGPRVLAFLGGLAVSVVFAVLWAFLFYGPHGLLAAAISLTIAALVTILPLSAAFAEQPWLGWVLVPYQAWLVIAASLSWGYLALNP